MNRRVGLASGSRSYRQPHHNQERHDISDLMPAAHRTLYLTDEQHEELLALIDQSVSDRANDDAERTDVSISLLSSVYEALSLIAKGQRTDFDGFMNNLVHGILSQYIIKNG